jgi:hypothetical protein
MRGVARGHSVRGGPSRHAVDLLEPGLVVEKTVEKGA